MNFTLACNVIKFWNSDYDFASHDRKVIDYANIYYIYGYGSPRKLEGFYIESINRESLEPFLFYENYEKDELEIISRSYKPTVLPYSNHNLTIFRGNLQMDIPFEIFVMKAKHPENSVFLHACKLFQNDGKLKVQNTKILWIEGSFLRDILFYKGYFSRKYEANYFNITGLQLNHTKMCDQFLVYFTGCQKPKVESHIVALIFGLAAIFVFITITWFYGFIKNYRKMRAQRKKDKKRKRKRARKNPDTAISVIYKPKDVPNITIN